MVAMTAPFALSLSKGERGFDMTSKTAIVCAPLSRAGPETRVGGKKETQNPPRPGSVGATGAIGAIGVTACAGFWRFRISRVPLVGGRLG